jgi:hypothetical protein
LDYSADDTKLGKVPSMVKLNTTGLNKKILFQHFKQGSGASGVRASTFSQDRALNKAIENHD